jgi:CHAT domain-containing protein
VTLSACDTGKGPIGETDVANLANAFIDAGAMSVVASLWSADDQATSELMQGFYQQLGRGDSVATALRKSQTTLIGDHLAPYYWATFEVSGDGSIGI